MPSFAVETLQNVASRHIPTDEAERKALYDAAQQLMYKVESGQDTAQRLYHGVRCIVVACRTTTDASIASTTGNRPDWLGSQYIPLPVPSVFLTSETSQGI